MSRLLIVGGGLFGSAAATLARKAGMETLVFDPGLSGSASHAAAGLFKEQWVGKKLKEEFAIALPILEQVYNLQTIHLQNDDHQPESFLFVPPSRILELNPIREEVTTIGDGWLEAAGVRYEGCVYIAAGVWCNRFVPGLGVYGKAGTAFTFIGEREGRVSQIAYGKQALAFVRDPGLTYFSDGTAEQDFTKEHEQQTLWRAREMGLSQPPAERYWGQRPYVPGGPVFRRLSEKVWLGTGGRKMGTVLGVAFAKRLVDELCRESPDVVGFR